MKKIFLLLSLAFLSGCANVPKIIHELAKDPASVHVSVKSIYVTVEVDRANPISTSPHSIKDGNIKVGEPEAVAVELESSPSIKTYKMAP